MATCLLGRYGTIELSTDMLNWTKIGNLVDATISFSIETSDCTTHDSNGIRQQHQTFRSASIDLSALYDDGDAGQRIITTAMINGTDYACRWRNKTEAGAQEIIGRTFATSESFSMPNEDNAEFTATLVMNQFAFGVQ